MRRSPVKIWLHMVGVLLILFSITMLPPLGVAWYYDEYGVIEPFVETLAATLALGLLCWGPVSYTHLDVYKRQDPDGRS